MFQNSGRKEHHDDVNHYDAKLCGFFETFKIRIISSFAFLLYFFSFFFFCFFFPSLLDDFVVACPPLFFQVEEGEGGAGNALMVLNPHFNVARHF